MKHPSELINLSIYTGEGKQMIFEAYDVIQRIDKGLSKEDITIINNFLDTNLYAGMVFLREKEYEMHMK